MERSSAADLVRPALVLGAWAVSHQRPQHYLPVAADEQGGRRWGWDLEGRKRGEGLNFCCLTARGGCGGGGGVDGEGDDGCGTACSRAHAGCCR